MGLMGFSLGGGVALWTAVKYPDKVRRLVVASAHIWRDAIPPDPKLLRASITGKTDMVTGAGGSIGSELCRQIIRHRPRLLVALDVSEFGLFQIQRELKRICADEGTPRPAVAAGLPLPGRPRLPVRGAHHAVHTPGGIFRGYGFELEGNVLDLHNHLLQMGRLSAL